MAKKSVKDQVEDRLPDQADLIALKNQLIAMLPDKEELADWRDQIGDRLPDKAELAALRDQWVEKLPDKAELLALRDELIEKLPDEVSDKLPVETQKAKRFATAKKVALVGVVTAGVAAAVAFVRAKMADQPSYTAPTYPPQNTTPPAPGSTEPPATPPTT